MEVALPQRQVGAVGGADLGDLVGVEDPSFPGLLDLLSSAGYGRVPIALDTEGPVPASFEECLRRVRAVVITPGRICRG